MLRFYWTLFVVVVLLLVIGIPAIVMGYALKKLFGVEDFVHPFAKFGCKVWIWSFGARVHVTGREHLEPGQAYVFAANHQSNVDPPMLFAYLGPITGAIAKKELTKFPIIKQGFPLAHVVPIDRRNRESAIESTRRGAAELRKGYSLMAFPEGTRSEDGRVKEFKKGVFFMALEAGVPVVPVVVNDTRLVWRKGGQVVTPGDVYLEILPPISTEGYNETNIEELIERVRSQIVTRVRTD
jgi:1-acyl-sn-glycerol-3-phosphate acyltransferase